MRKPAFSKNFALTETQRSGFGALLFVGNMKLACSLVNRGVRNIISVPEGENPLEIDWSFLKGECVSVRLYESVDVRKFGKLLLTSGVKDFHFFDCVKGRIAGLHLSTESKAMLLEIQGGAA